jgi:hypothetical protein
MNEEIKGGDFEVLTPNTVHDRPGVFIGSPGGPCPGDVPYWLLPIVVGDVTPRIFDILVVLTIRVEHDIGAKR